MNVEKTLKNLELRGFETRHFATSAEAADYVNSQINDSTVGIGGSKTIEAMGLYETLSERNTVYWHWKTPGMETLEKAATTDYYMCSANAITENGEIINCDGNGNRVASTAFGHKKLFIIAGTNKIVSDLNSGIERMHAASVINNRRFDKFNPPCKLDNKCHDCRSATRTCRVMTVLFAPSFPMPTEVILIDEELGY